MDFTIKPHQSFHQSLLIYHGVGVGNTPIKILEINTLIKIVESYVQKNDGKKLFMIKVQINAETFVNTGASKQREVNKLIKQYYELMGFPII